MRLALLPALAVLACSSVAARAQGLLDYVGECAPFARLASGIQIRGDAWTWWDAAEGRYQRGTRPQIGAVLVFRRSERLKLGHVAVVSRIVTPRVIMVTHANWSRVNGERGHVERDATLTDVSESGDWSMVRVFYRDSDGLGASTYPVYGFIYGRPSAGMQTAEARPSGELSSSDPDYIASLIYAN